MPLRLKGLNLRELQLQRILPNVHTAGPEMVPPIGMEDRKVFSLKKYAYRKVFLHKKVIEGDTVSRSGHSIYLPLQF